MRQIRDHGGLREWLRDLRSGIGWCHLGHPDSPSGQQPDAWCGATKGAWLIWWFTPTCPKCKRLADAY